MVGHAFRVAGGECAELFEPVEAALDDVAIGIDGLVERWWSAAVRTLRPTTFDLINSFWAGERDPA